MINKPVTSSQKTASVDTAITTITATAKPSLQTTTVTEPTTAASTASAPSTVLPHHIASGIELNIPVEKIEAEKKTPVTVSQLPSIAAPPTDVPEPSSSSTQSNAKKDKKEKDKEKKRKFVRMAAGTVWEDQTLGEWDLGE